MEGGGGRGKSQGSNFQEEVSHTYTQIRLEYNFYLVFKKIYQFFFFFFAMSIVIGSEIQINCLMTYK